MLSFSLGLIVGLLLAIICMLSIRRNQTKIERTVKRLENGIRQKGSIFIETDEEKEFENFMDSLPKI